VRRIVLIGVALAAVVAGFVALAADGDGDGYEVRAAFDNGAFLVPGEEVRIAGVRVGTVADVDVSGTDEPVREDGSADPGKAIVVLRIDDPAFQDFRADASCLIRPQSLIGEKFVECEPTGIRTAGDPLPPPLEEVPEGEPGEGQRFLPLERNGKAVDLDLVNNIMDEPYPDRLRLILNDLGAGLAARGDELAEVVERANPALRRTNEVLAILARQNRRLASLARDGDRVLRPLARDRDRVSGFINEAETVAAASAERSADIEAGFERLPGALRELRPTMAALQGFADQATPVFADLRAAAPSLTRASTALGPFSEAATTSLVTLGDAAAEAQRPLIRSDPVIRQLRGLARTSEPGAKNLARLLRSLRRTQGFDYLTELIFNTTGSVNAFDSFGHFTRVTLPNNNCVDYTTIPGQQGGSCDARFGGAKAATATAAEASTAGSASAEGSGGSAAATPAGRARDARALLGYLVGDAAGEEGS